MLALQELIGDIDVILVSNSYWIGEDTPCLTFGLRGVIHATLKITSDQPDLHSGMQGGVVSEPLVDMVRLLASLTDADGRVSSIRQAFWVSQLTRPLSRSASLASLTMSARWTRRRASYWMRSSPAARSELACLPLVCRVLTSASYLQ